MLDGTDRRIIRLRTQDGRMSSAAMARRHGCDLLYGIEFDAAAMALDVIGGESRDATAVAPQELIRLGETHRPGPRAGGVMIELDHILAVAERQATGLR